MQYAEIVPNTKTDLKTQTFTYKIPPQFLPNLKMGSLVLIPFGKRKIEGIIIDFVKKAAKEAKKIKPILGIIESELADKTHIDLAKWMAEYYLAPLSLCLFEMIAIPPKRWGASEQQTAISNQQFSLSSNLYSLSPILKLCQKALDENKQVLVLFPEINLAKNYLPHLQQKFSASAQGYGGPAETSSEGGKKVVLYHGGLNKNERWRIWQEAKRGEFDIVCGSRLALFLPLSRLGLIIINEEEAEGYKNERSPRYNLKTVAQKLTQFLKTKLVLISSAPSIESYFLSDVPPDRKKVYLLKPKLSNFSPKSYLVDMKKEIQRRNFSPLSEILQSLLKRMEKLGKRSILFVNRRGAASYIFCKDCGYILRCPNCDLPLTYHFLSQISNRGATSKSQILLCHHCSFKTAPSTACPNCQGLNLKFGGLGTQKIETEFKKIFIKPTILRIDKDLPDRFLPSGNNYDFIIGTQKLFSRWFEPVDLVAIVSIDSFLNLPEFHQGEKTFSIISKLKSLAREIFIIQTHHPENLTVQSALKDDYQGFYKKDIEERKKLGFPPFSRLIRVIYQHKNEEKCRKEIEFLAKKLSSLIEILGPSPCFYSKIRGKFRWQIIIKLKAQSSKFKAAKSLLKTLPPDWVIDVDPVTLL